MELLVPAMSLENQLLAKLAADLNPEQEMEDWSKYVDPDPARWIQNNFYIKDTKAPLQLFDCQIVPLREALSKDERGLYRYSTVVWSAPKKNGKTLIASAVCLFFAWQRPWSTCKCIGNDAKQATGRVFLNIVQAIRLHPEWSQICKVVQNKITLPNHSVIEAVPIDPEGEAGAADDFVSYTEIWGWRSKAEVRFWAESSLPPAKYGKALRWIDSYAGEVGASPVLENLYEEGVKRGECINQQYEMYRNKRLFALWGTKYHLPPPYFTPEYLEQQRSELTPDQFRRLHENQWIAPTATFIPIEWWDGCRVDDVGRLSPSDPLVIGVDAGVWGDSFGIVAVSGWQSGKLAVRYARRWMPPKNDKVHFVTEENDGPEDELIRLCDQLNIIEIAFDPMHLEDLAQRFEDDQVANMYRFSQSSERAVADKRLFDTIRGRNIVHSGEVELKEHLQNADRKNEGDQGRLRIIKRAEHLKIDLAVALSMAVDRARSWGL